MAHLSLSFLGGFKVTLGGRPITQFGADKARALLAFLAIESAHPHRRSILAGMFWPELPEERAAHNLSQTLLRLRRALHETKMRTGSPSAFLLLNSQEVRFNPLSDHHLDVAEFLELLRAARQHKHAEVDSCTVCGEWLRQAAELYRGDLLAGFALRDSLPFEEWQVVQREALHRQALEVMNRLADHYERQDEPTQVLEYAQRAVALEPWQEQPQMRVMAALARLGQEAAALEQYTSYCQMLAQEFGAQPSTETTELYERIRSRQLADRLVKGTATGISTAPDERRQVTAMLCRWQISETSDDPEDVQAGLTRFSQHFAEVVKHYGGSPPQRQGSEFLAYFGFPLAMENAAWHAVRAALTLIAEAHEQDHIRIGIDTGMMVKSGDDLIGNVPDLARDCMRLAESGSVMLTAMTERLVHNRFICQPIGNAGSIEPAPAYRVQVESADPHHLTWQPRQKSQAQFIGREAELKQLALCLERIQQRQGQIVTVRGEAGIGKTRLTREFKKMCPWPAVWIETHCSPFFQNTSLRPIIDLLGQLLEFQPGDDDSLRLKKLTAALAQDQLTSPSTLWLLAVLLGLPTEKPAPQTMTEDQREHIRQACLTLLQGEASRQPLMLLIEDLQWADPTTIAWLGRSLDALAAARCVLWLNWRPEFVAPWLPRPNLLSLSLQPLEPFQVDRMMSDVAGQEILPEDVRQQIVARADGIPLYVEELTQTVIDPATPQTLSLPVTLRDSLAVRLDRVGAARETAQWAAILGREFEYPILRATVPFAEQRLQADLTVLLESGLIIVQDEAPHQKYAFRHALLQEATYDSVLKRARQEHHQRIAETLTTRFPHIVEKQPEVLAEHYSRSGISSLAADYWLRAGERAIAIGATLEARTFFDRALAEIDPADHERRWQALEGRERVFDLRGEREAQQDDINALLELAETFSDDTRRAQAFLHQKDYASRRNDYPAMLRASETAISAARRAGNRDLEMKGLSGKVQALTTLESWDAARQAVEETLEKIPEVADSAIQAQALSGLSIYYVRKGDFFYALTIMEQATIAARRAGDSRAESHFDTNIGFTYAQLGAYTKARTTITSGLALAEAIGDRALQNTHRINLSYVYWCEGNQSQAQALGEQALQEYRTVVDHPIGQAFCLAYLGYYQEQLEDYAAAVAYLAEACADFAHLGLNSYRMEPLAMLARCQLALGHQAEARQLATEAWAYLSEHGTEGVDFPSRAYLSLADVLAQIPTPDITEQEVVLAGYTDLLRRADMITDPAWRRAFLEDELSNRALIARWQSLNQSTSSDRSETPTAA